MSLHCNRRTQLLLLTGLILLVLLVAFLAGRLIPDSAVAADFAQAKEPPSCPIPSARTTWGGTCFANSERPVYQPHCGDLRLCHQRRGGGPHRHCGGHRLPGHGQLHQLAH